MIANVFSSGLSLVTVPVFTRIMSTEQVGLVGVYTAWFSMIVSFSTLSLTSGGFALAMKDYDRERDEYISSLLFLTTIIALALSVMYSCNKDFWVTLLGLPRSLICLLIFGLFVTPAREFWISKERYGYSFRVPAIVIVTTALLSSLSALMAVIWANNNYVSETGYYRLLAQYGVIYLIDAVIFFFLIKKGKTLINLDYWKYSLKLSIPLVGYSVSAQILNVSDRVMIEKLVNKGAVGIYGTLYSIASVPLIIWTTINATFVPYLFKNIEKREIIVTSVANALMVCFGGVMVLFSFLAPEIVKVLATEEYVRAVYIIPPIAVGTYMMAVSNIYSNILVFYKKTVYIMYGAMISATLNILLNLVFITKLGYGAAAYTTLASYIAFAFIEYYYAAKYDKVINGNIPTVYNNKAILGISLGVIILCMTGLFLYEQSILRYIIAACILMVLIINLWTHKEKLFLFN